MESACISAHFEATFNMCFYGLLTITITFFPKLDISLLAPSLQTTGVITVTKPGKHLQPYTNHSGLST